MPKTATLLFTAALSLAAFGAPQHSAGAPPPSPIPMQAAFGDTSGDMIKSDLGTYVNNVGGIECNINPNGGDFRLNLSRTKPQRYMWAYLDLGAQVPTDCASSVVSPPPTPFLAGWYGFTFVNVNHLLQVTSTDWVETGASFHYSPVGDLYFAPYYRNYPCTTHVLARSAPVTINGVTKPGWEIRAPGDPTYGIPGFHDIALLVQSYKSQTVPVGYLYLPFTLYVQPL